MHADGAMSGDNNSRKPLPEAEVDRIVESIAGRERRKRYGEPLTESQRLGMALRGEDPGWGEMPVSSWLPVDLDPILAGDHEPEESHHLRRTDGVALLYPGRVHSVFAEPEAGKGWLALAACKESLDNAEQILYIDYEDTAQNIVARLRDLGIDDDLIRGGFDYVRPDEPIGDWSHASPDLMMPHLVVIDGLTEAYAVEGLDIANNQDIAEFNKRIPKPYAGAGAAVLMIDHVVKDREARGRYAIGGQHKLAGIDAAYRLDVVRPFARGHEGIVKVTVMKDRPGHVRQHSADRSLVGFFKGISTPDGRMTTRLEPGEDTSGPFRPTHLMERVSLELEQRPGLNKRGVRLIRGNKDALDLALELLIEDGYVEARPERQSIRHYSLKPFREDAS